MGDGNSHQYILPPFVQVSYVMSQLCVKVMVDDGCLSIAVLLHVGFKSLHVGYK